MGRRGGMRGRPGILFIAIFTVFLVIFYWSWRSLTTTDIKPGPRHIDIIQRQNAFNNKRIEDRPDLRNSYPRYSGKKEQFSLDKETDRDQDYVWRDSRPTQAPHSGKADIPAVPEEKDNDIETKMLKLVTKQENVAPIREAANILAYYRKPNDVILKTVETMERFVHLDLKGAALKMEYLREFIPFLSTLGATGVLMEYEDMFPFSGLLQNVSAKNCYTKENIKEMLDLFNKNNLKVMPLIQTFGHMEYVLKSVFHELRESSHTPQVIDVSSNKSYAVISEMVKQVLDAHPHVTHLHIGCDEVYELGRGQSAKVMQNEKLTETEIFLRHVKKVATIVSSYKKRTVMWDDELRGIPPKEIEASGLPSLVDIMVWNYTPDVFAKVNSSVWNKYADVFKSVWIASSFKGASGSRQFFTEPQLHVRNHLSWLEVIAAHRHHLVFKGVALTGWQRYDHFATLCELLPVAIPSLALCLTTMKNGGLTEELHESISELMRCDQPLEMTFPEFDEKKQAAVVHQDCRFPGHDVYYGMQMFYGFTQIKTQHRIDGWLSDYQVAHGFSNPGQLRVLLKSLQAQLTGYVKVQHVLSDKLIKIYSEDTVDEWIEENIGERKRRNQEITRKVVSLLEPKTWARRPLPRLQIILNGSKEVSYISFPDGTKEIPHKPNDFQEPTKQVQVQTKDDHLETRRQNQLERNSDQYLNTQQNPLGSHSRNQTYPSSSFGRKNETRQNLQNNVSHQHMNSIPKIPISPTLPQGIGKVIESNPESGTLRRDINKLVDNRGEKDSLLYRKLGIQGQRQTKPDVGNENQNRNNDEARNVYSNDKDKDVQQFDIKRNSTVLNKIDQDDALRRAKYMDNPDDPLEEKRELGDKDYDDPEENKDDQNVPERRDLDHPGMEGFHRPGMENPQHPGAEDFHRRVMENVHNPDMEVVRHPGMEDSRRLGSYLFDRNKNAENRLREDFDPRFGNHKSFENFKRN